MKKIIFSIIIAFVACYSNAQVKQATKPTSKAAKKEVKPSGIDRSIRPVAGKAPEINIKDSEVFMMENGLTIVLSENHKLPKVSMNLVMNSTPELEKQKAGLSEIAGQLILSGTSNKSKDELDNEIDYIGATFSSTDNSIYVSCLKKHLAVASTLFADVIMNANFPQSEFDRIVKQMESSLISDKTNPNKIAQNVVRKVNFEKHPYGEIMTERTLKSLTREDVVNYYKRKFTPNGSYLVIVGDMTKEEAISHVNNYFSNWTGKGSVKKELGKGTYKKGNSVYFVKKPGAVQSVVSITFPIDLQPGHVDQIPFSVANSILGAGGFASRLMQNLREDKAYTYGCYSNAEVTENGSWFTASGSFRNEVTDSAITQLLFELNRIRTDLVSDEELNLIKSSMAGDFARSLENPSTIARFALKIIQNNLPKDYYQTYLKKLEAVDKNAVLEMAKKYFTAENCNIVVVGSEDIANKLKVFDTDGKIEFLDAFARPVSGVKKSDITEDQLLVKYVLAVTESQNIKESTKKIAKIKKLKQEYEVKSAMFPGSMSMVNYFAAPNKEAMKMEMQGMLIQKTYFDGTKGGSANMQTGKAEMTAEEIAAKNKSVGFIPELNYRTSGMSYELIGLEEENGKNFYVLKTNDGKAEKRDYFDSSTFLKFKTVQIENGQESTIMYDDYKVVNGIKFPHALKLSVAGMTMDGTIKTIEINGKIENSVFE